ncbi:MAG: 50S ribosomal protein L32e [Candidatus Aenigmarchaeota archaeon]|nr:50S ribosomal protein L32e [Candidatus Aenigmarchaeota archaeon]
MTDAKSTGKLLKVRRRKKARKPDFRRQEGYRYKRLGDAWRRPKGRHSKLRKGQKPRGKKPGVGHMSPPAVRGLTRQGYEPVLVSNKASLAVLDPCKHAVIIGSAVGKRKRSEIVVEAERMKIKVLNAYKFKLPNPK